METSLDVYKSNPFETNRKDYEDYKKEKLRFRIMSSLLLKPHIDFMIPSQLEKEYYDVLKRIEDVPNNYPDGKDVVNMLKDGVNLEMKHSVGGYVSLVVAIFSLILSFQITLEPNLPIKGFFYIVSLLTLLCFFLIFIGSHSGISQKKRCYDEQWMRTFKKVYRIEPQPKNP
ncbi:MAG: hypothetical protein WC974_02995 [Thermoplasmata archaeon]